MTVNAKLDARPFRELCDCGYRPRKLTGIFQLWLIQHFSNPANIREFGIKDRIWDPDPDVSKIQILPLEDWKPRHTEQRPALIIKQQEIKFVRYGIDNKLMGGFGADAATRNHMAGLAGSHTVFCIAGEAAEVAQLAAEVSQELMKFAPVVRQWLNFLRIELVSIGEISKLEEATENFVVPINIAYAFLEKWELIGLDDPKLVGLIAAIEYR